jgi:hypothetical protein
MSEDVDQVLSPELFEGLLEYIIGLQGRRRFGWSSEDGDSDPEFLSDSHPLVTFCHDVLEQLSVHALRHPVDGFGWSSRRALISERRRLERRQMQPALQRLLLELEASAAFLDTAGYARSEEETWEFLRGPFLTLLRSVARYLGDATDEGLGPEDDAAELAGSALSELEYYLGVEGEGQ